MIVERFYDEKLAQASYMVGCAATGEAIVIDPNRDTEPYVAAAKSEGLRITHITETHIHADFVSGARELAERTKGRLYLSGEGGPDWSYGFAERVGAQLIRDGDRIRVGNVVLDVMHTPGHTPEHVCFLVTDTAGADAPMGIFTGDFVFVGDVGRPDLLERAAGHGGTMDAAARDLFRSLARFRALPEWVQVWPGHGAGSACGKALGAVPSTTVGYELRFNWAFGHDLEDAFVEAVLEGQPEPPRYFAEMKRINRDGPRLLGDFRRPDRMADARLEEALRGEGPVVDTRRAADFAAGHVPGTISIPLNRSFTTWAGSLLPYDTPFTLIVAEDRAGALDEGVRDLAMIGLDRIAGWFGTSAIDAWADRHGELARIEQVDAAALAEGVESGRVQLVDVRGRSEWEAGHVAGATHIPLNTLQQRLDEVRRDTEVVLQCATGSRSAIAAALLRANGFERVANHQGGFEQWRREGLPVEVGDAPVST